MKDHPAVIGMYTVQGETLDFEINSSFFETEGWQADKQKYGAKFNPATGWVSKKRGEVYMLFEGEANRTKCMINTLVEHNLKILTIVLSSDSEDESVDDPGDPDDQGGHANPDLSDSSPDPKTPSNAGPSRADPNRTQQNDDSAPPSPGEPLQPAPTGPIPATLATLATHAAVDRCCIHPAVGPQFNGYGAADQNAIETDVDEVVDSSDEEAEQLEQARAAFGTTYEKTTQDAKQPVRKVVWTLVDHTKLPKICARANVEGRKGTEYEPMLINVGGKDVGNLFGMWKHLVPPEWIPKLVATANTKLFEDPVDKNWRKTSEAEVICILGMALGSTVMGVPFEKCFAVSKDPDSLLAPCQYGQYGVTKNRALIVLRHAHLSEGPMKPAGADPHWFIDGPLTQFNDHMRTAYRHSWYVTADESGPMWHGGEGEDDFHKCPHVSYVPRKPEPVAAEFNDVADALTRMMIYIEFEKAVKYHKDEKHMDTVGSYNAAMTVRMGEAAANANAAMMADSRFGSVKAAYFAKKLNDLHSLFDIKTATALYPRKELQKLCPSNHGGIIVMTAEVEGVEMFAIGQRRGPSVHTFLSTFGTFVEEVPSRYKQTTLEEAPWKTVQILNKGTLGQPAVDAWNRQVFDLLGLQYNFRTTCFETRFSQHFLLPATYVNTINACKYFYSNTFAGEDTKTLAMKLATQMATNKEWLDTLTPAGSGSGGGTRGGQRYNPSTQTWYQVHIDGGPPSRESPGKHVLILLSQLEGYKGAKQQRCWECNELVSWCCARCSTPNSIVPLHPPLAQGSKRRYACLHCHRQNPAGGYKAAHQACTGTSVDSKRRRRIPIEILN